MCTYYCKMQGTDTTTTTTPSEAAELVLRERQRQREAAEAAKRSRRAIKSSSSSSTINGSSSTTTKPDNNNDDDSDEIRVELETVSVPKWDGADQGDVNESELDRRQRALSQQLERRQREMLEQSEKLARVREELKELEQPIKADIMTLREKLEHANREEITLVQGVNMLRKELAVKEKSLVNIRKDKQEFADQLIKVMADYERRKTERLNEIVSLVGVAEDGSAVVVGNGGQQQKGGGVGGAKRAGGLAKGASKSASFSGF